MKVKGKIKKIDIRETFRGDQIAFIIFATNDQKLELIVYPTIFKKHVQFLKKSDIQITITGVKQTEGYIMVQHMEYAGKD